MASADILRAAHSPLPWSVQRAGRAKPEITAPDPEDENWPWLVAKCETDAPNDKAGKNNAAFIVRACNAHYQMLEALKALDAWWTDSFPAGPDAADVSYGFGKLSEDTLAIWRQVRAAIAAAEAEAGR